MYDKQVDISRQQDRKINQTIQNQLINVETLDKEKHLTAAYEDFKDRLCYKYLISHDSTDFKILE